MRCYSAFLLLGAIPSWPGAADCWPTDMVRHATSLWRALGAELKCRLAEPKNTQAGQSFTASVQCLDPWLFFMFVGQPTKVKDGHFRHELDGKSPTIEQLQGLLGAGWSEHFTPTNPVGYVRVLFDPPSLPKLVLRQSVSVDSDPLMVRQEMKRQNTRTVKPSYLRGADLLVNTTWSVTLKGRLSRSN
jgi:hypothetical protein